MSGADDSGATTRFEGYSDYQTVANSIARSIDEALDAWATLQSLHAEGAKVRAQEAAEARARVISAALRLVPELREDAPDTEEYQEILARWLGGYGEGDDAVRPEFGEFDLDRDKGFIDGLNDIRLQTSCPDWLYQFVLDIRTAGWELGYLKAGRTTTETDLDPADEDAAAMFD